jgi:hypothetical protein
LTHGVPKDDVKEVKCDRRSVLGNPFLMGVNGKDGSKREQYAMHMQNSALFWSLRGGYFPQEETKQRLELLLMSKNNFPQRVPKQRLEI